MLALVLLASLVAEDSLVVVSGWSVDEDRMSLCLAMTDCHCLQIKFLLQSMSKKNATRLLLLAFSCLQTWHEKSFRISSSDTSAENK